ncbi:glycosyltransferase family 2 protein [Jiella avicenniae]|uniref:Glycosyltransferase n=1 Tax=Jiella avicenniae TaxID=2907202 RepID=A0A9X1T7V0_9HYPH|nr:glycosyltransferase family 2 protein [Jiella avicenniae]MCE7030850.1 glycosyltransferase [Jiella avicenniae]
MKFSIVTISFNQREFLERAIRSVISQSGVDIEYIVVDPGSTDGSRELIESYRNQISKIVFEPDAGPADGLNKGFAHATGDWFGYINSDDFFLNGALAQASEAIARNPTADCIYGDGYITDADGRPRRRVISKPFDAWSFVWGRSLVLQQSTFIRADGFREVGGFNIDNRTSWDAELLLDMSLSGKTLKHVPGLWSAFAIHEGSITGSQRHSALSKLNHERMFRKVTGRDRTTADLRRMKFYRHFDQLLQPRLSASKIADRLVPGRLPASLVGFDLQPKNPHRQERF